MSFFTYYGMLKDDLFVVVLPNGTVELDDPIHIYTQKQFMSYRARDVSVTNDGEDRITFHDGYYTFDAVSSKAYRSLSITRKIISSGETESVTLTRHYDQPQTSNLQADRLKIWTGAIDFHEWAKNESFVVIAPKGLGDGKPAVAMWQWTKDKKGAPKTLSYGVSKQVSDSGNIEKFSFQQNDYYTLDCQVNAATKGLNVTIKAPTNANKAQNELILAHQTELGAEHRFSPPRARQEKKTLDCSLPNAKPSLPRITAALPFPADLVETLSYSAAYVDQAGYLAKYAVKQFEKLDRSYHLLEKKAETRAAKVNKLEGDVTRLTSENQSLTNRNAVLEKQIAENRKDAEKREAALEERLRKALAALHASEGREKRLEAANRGLRKDIAQDLIEDMERERRHKEHDEADHKAIDLANDALREAQATGKHLKEELESKNKTIAELEACLDATRCQLHGAEDEILRLREKLSAEEKEKAELKEKLDAALHKLEVAERDLGHLRTENLNLKAALGVEKEKNTELQKKLEQATADLKKADQDIVNLNKKIEKKDADIKSRDVEISEQDDKIASLRRQLKETEETNKEQSEMWAAARAARDIAETKVESLKKELRGLRDTKSDVQVSMAEITI